MKRLLQLIFISITCYSFSQVQNVTYTIVPSTFNQGDQITITFSNVDPTLWNAGQPDNIYLWAWYFDLNNIQIGDAPNNGSWNSSNEAQKLTNNGNGTYSITLTPTTFFNDTGIGKFGMLVKAKDGTGDKKSQDIIVDVGAFQLTLTAPTNNITLLTSGQSLSIAATTSIPADFVLKANGSTINTSNNTVSYSFNHTNITQNTSYSLEATNNGNTLTKTFQAIVTITEEPVPAGMEDGINLNTIDNTKATLVLYAPNKDVVHVIGDFNNWQIDNNYLLKKDSTKDRFWIELTGLTPLTNHMYQYVVDGYITIADPYATTILDETNDGFINTTTYPNLPAYPSGQTNHAVTSFRTGDTPYNWQTTNFQGPAKTDLVIYELLIRDFDALHSFDAVKARLDYLQNLGVNAIELMPVSEFDGNESWGYNPSFHMALDKYYGTPTAFKQFIDACHSRGIAVILDVVYNHATGQNPYYRMWNTNNGDYGGQASTDSPFFNPVATHSYSVFNDFRHDTQATKDYVKRTTQYWIDEYNIDGFRWDLTKGFTQNCTSSDENCTGAYQADRVAVLKEYADYQWAMDPDFYVIFEHLGTNPEETEWVNYRLGEGKGIMVWGNHNYNFREATMGWNANSDFSWISYLNRGWTVPASVSYMESHDEERLMYKNLQSGNSNGTYNIKTLATALDREELAGAFYFTVPGPKMIWQFGELGYDISIDDPCRVCNKPILWNYFTEPDRKELYDAWANLIKLKTLENIFRTDNFTLDVANANGLKKIHLTLDSASGTVIKYVTIIGNFGVTAQSIIPDFQETGSWYNLLDNNRIFEVTDTSGQINLGPGEFKVYGNNPFIDPDDLDSDGVLNSQDTCPNTPFGAIVDVNGCEVFTLPTDNYSIATTSETCRNSDNGKITVTAATLFNYTVSVTGPNGLSISESFTANWTLDNLQAGNYKACFTVAGEPNYEQCFDLKITEPEDLSVLAEVNYSIKQMALKLGGADLYFVTLNGITQETSESQITLDLMAGNNTLHITTAQDCQGIYEKTVFISEDVTLYPNPVKSDVNVYISGEDSQMQIQIFQIDGKLIMNKTLDVKPNRLINIPVSQLSHGQYLVHMLGNTTNKTIKIIKQ